jgi:hypothetical protein
VPRFEQSGGFSLSAVNAPVWTRIAPTRVRAILVSFLFGLALLRFAVAVLAALKFNQGDFLATLPGAYAERWNLALWDSPDLQGAVPGFHFHGYAYGPTQYLTLWPIVFLDSYRQIAAVLLGVYIAVVFGIAYVLWRLCETLIPDQPQYRWGRLMTVAAAVLMFAPMLMALGQREFEIVQALMLVVAAYYVARGGPLVAGAVLGYIAMFKYWIVGLLGYFILKRQWKAAAVFVAAVVAVLLLAHAAFDLARFPFASRRGIDRQFGRVYRPLDQGASFCAPVSGTAANVKTGLCAIAGGRDGLARAMFYGLIAAAGSLFLLMFVLSERLPPAGALDERWRRIVEFCLLMIAAGVVFHGHYYYLSILILPLTVVLYRNFWDPRPGASARLCLALVAYALLSAFVIPLSVLSRVTGGDSWSFYLSHGIYVYGIAILSGLLLWEYSTLVRPGRRAARVTA